MLVLFLLIEATRASGDLAGHVNSYDVYINKDMNTKMSLDYTVAVTKLKSTKCLHLRLLLN